ncbi:DUF1499 domain-containing protein [Henriciella litoralis]|uniref:DUF1499 domain-containing protein n=1 Tax=Henriciella litoralis TaxID=568102 RepID=UPI0009FD174B|nr:DUF1499 domain-containing protein [Henriciella litoralis]
MTFKVDFSAIERPSKPNTFLLGVSGLTDTGNHDDISPVFPVPAERLYAIVHAHITGEDRWTITQEDAGAMQLDTVAKTKLLKFKDDVAIKVVTVDEKQSQLAVYSRSRIGHSDLGANEKRVRSLVQTLQQKTGSAA